MPKLVRQWLKGGGFYQLDHVTFWRWSHGATKNVKSVLCFVFYMVFVEVATKMRGNVCWFQRVVSEVSRKFGPHCKGGWKGVDKAWASLKVGLAGGWKNSSIMQTQKKKTEKTLLYYAVLLTTELKK